MDDIQVIILAAGEGKRMHNPVLPKVLISLRGQPIIVVGNKADLIKARLGPAYPYVYQAQQLGTGHAVAVTRAIVEGKAKHIMVLYGDHPFVSAQTIQKIAQTHLDSQAVLTMATTTVADFDDWRASFDLFGRVVRDDNNQILKIVERKDAMPEIAAIKEVNPAYFCFQADWLWSHIDKIQNNNAQAEYYLTDLVDLAFQEKQKIATVDISPREALGVNTAEHLDLLEKL
jgi:bifunctional UDP-N-acetylglucosamine pyrophosphorylase / glucosamine-1-phosphate N-acetyltransferase